MERIKPYKLVIGIGGPVLALSAGIGCGGESSKNKTSSFVGDATVAAGKVENTNSEITFTPIAQVKAAPEGLGVTKSRRKGEPVGDFNIGNTGGKTLNYKKDLAGRAVIIYYCCVNGGTDTAKIEGLKSVYDESKLVIVNVHMQDSIKGLLPPVVEENTSYGVTSFSGFSCLADPCMVAIDKHGILFDVRYGGNTVSAGIDQLADKLANGE